MDTGLVVVRVPHTSHWCYVMYSGLVSLRLSLLVTNYLGLRSDWSFFLTDLMWCVFDSRRVSLVLCVITNVLSFDFPFSQKNPTFLNSNLTWMEVWHNNQLKSCTCGFFSKCCTFFFTLICNMFDFSSFQGLLLIIWRALLSWFLL